MPITGHVGDLGNQISWHPASLDNVAFFIVQRSDDGENYRPVGMVRVKKDLDYYSFTDEKAGTDDWFYRVVIVNTDGVGTYSGAVYLEYEAPTLAGSTKDSKPPTNIVLNDNIANQLNKWLIQLENPTISKLGTVAHIDIVLPCKK